MDSEGLHLNIDYVGSSGILLSPEQKAALQTSLAILKSNYKFNKVKYWGKIKGLKDDYHIAQGVGNDELSDKRTLYSKDCVSWGLLPPATEKMKKESKLAKGRFTGDPSYEFEHVEIKKTISDNEEVQEEEETTTIKEEDRLSSVIAEIDDDVCIVPRGAYMKSPTGQVMTNRSFEGLSVSESVKFSSFLHFREPKWLPEKSLLQKANMDRSIDFLDVVEEDIPRGSWSIQFERGSGLVTLRSLLWQGYVFYHIPATRKFGSVYVGTGEKNMDLAFML
jgi:radial spoke head protein 9